MILGAWSTVHFRKNVTDVTVRGEGTACSRWRKRYGLLALSWRGNSPPQPVSGLQGISWSWPIPLNQEGKIAGRLVEEQVVESAMLIQMAGRHGWYPRSGRMGAHTPSIAGVFPLAAPDVVEPTLKRLADMRVINNSCIAR